MLTDTITTHGAAKINMEPVVWSVWECHLFGTGKNGMVLRPLKGGKPIWFWRWMQWLCFGNKWVKNAKDRL